MKSLLAIVSKNQSQHVTQMAAAIHDLSRRPDGIILVLDRPSPRELVETRNAFEGSRVKIIVVGHTPDNMGRPCMDFPVHHFCAGACRNVAIEYALTQGYDAVIFIDGDSFPEPNLIKGHLSILGNDAPTISVGRRCERMYDWHDQREGYCDNPIPIFTRMEQITKEAFFVDSGIIWTCNIGMNRLAIESIRHLNKTLFGREEVFSSDFCGTWGGEDGYLGLEAYYTGIEMYPVCAKHAGIRHADHPRPEEKYDHETFVDILESKREELMFLMKGEGRDCCGHIFIPKDIIVGDRNWMNP